jgi:hypothetical protein
MQAANDNHNEGSLGAPSSTPTTRRIVGVARKHPPRKTSNWRNLGPQVVLVILLSVMLGWLATQAWCRAEARPAPTVPIGILIFPAGAKRLAFLDIEKDMDQSALEFLALGPNTSGLGAAS